VLGNLINRPDAVRLYRKLRRGQVAQIVGKVRAPGPDRVLARWSAPGHAAGQVQWDEIPAVRRRWHTFGGGQTSFAEHVTGRWLTGGPGLRALSLGCGAGDREIGQGQALLRPDQQPGRSVRPTPHRAGNVAEFCRTLERSFEAASDKSPAAWAS